jgi:hypothetical protein
LPGTSRAGSGVSHESQGRTDPIACQRDVGKTGPGPPQVEDGNTVAVEKVQTQGNEPFFETNGSLGLRSIRLVVPADGVTVDEQARASAAFEHEGVFAGLRDFEDTFEHKPHGVRAGSRVQSDQG